MNHKSGVILGCVLGVSSQPYCDWNRWQLPIFLRYCPATEPRADRCERSEEMVRLEVAGFVPLALVATDADCQAGLGLMMGHDTPVAIREYLIQEAQQIFDQALEIENLRGAA